jgi:hypothetical protein
MLFRSSYQALRRKLLDTNSAAVEISGRGLKVISQIWPVSYSDSGSIFFSHSIADLINVQTSSRSQYARAERRVILPRVTSEIPTFRRDDRSSHFKIIQ